MEFIQKFIDMINGLVEMIKNLVKTIRDFNDNGGQIPEDDTTTD